MSPRTACSKQTKSRVRDEKSTPRLVALNNSKALRAAGIPFETEHQARWAKRQSSENGLSGAFVRIGRRVFIDVPRFHELVRKAR